MANNELKNKPIDWYPGHIAKAKREIIKELLPDDIIIINNYTEESLKKKAVKGVLWNSVERFSVQGVQFLIMLIIARVLDPKDFGLIGMLTIFLAVAQSLIDSGFSQALPSPALRRGSATPQSRS